MKFKKGDVVWVSHKGTEKQMTIKTAGTKYITFEEMHRSTKFDAETLREINAYGIASYIIPDIEKHREKIEKIKKRHFVDRYKWENLKDEEISKVYDLLKEFEK